MPIGTPAVPGGGKPTPIPMAGPYCVASASGGQVVAGAEPELHGRPAAPDRAHRLHDGVKPADAIARVEQRECRLCQRRTTVSFDRPGRSLPAARSTTRTDWRAGPAGRASARYLPSPAPGFDGIAFNTQRPLFRDVRMRRAAAYALDRSRLRRVFGEQPTDRLIPPAIGGAWRQHRLPDEPDLASGAQARRPGASRKATLYSCGDPDNRRIAEIVRANLAEIGIDVRIDQSSGA